MHKRLAITNYQGEAQMTTPHDRYLAVVRARALLNELASGAEITKDHLRRASAAILKHLPSESDMNRASSLAPEIFSATFLGVDSKHP
jgi:hypothetical protein